MPEKRSFFEEMLTENKDKFNEELWKILTLDSVSDKPGN